MPGATVSVVIAAYNAMPYLTQCITSVAEQSIGRERLESSSWTTVRRTARPRS